MARLVLMTLASPAMAVPPDIGLFFQAGSRDEGESRNALAALARDWDNAFPGTTVLSLETGFDRDYSEGAAYRGYFATDRLMFDIPAEDNRLKNKADRARGPGYQTASSPWRKSLRVETGSFPQSSALPNLEILPVFLRFVALI